MNVFSLVSRLFARLACALGALFTGSCASAASTGSTGSATPAAFENRQPTTALTWVICVNGAFPTADPSVTASGEPFLGELRLVAFASTGFSNSFRWLPCDGRSLPINQNQALYFLLGTTYGGNGQTQFSLPDLRGRVPVGLGAGPGLTPRVLGEKGGSESTTLAANVSSLQHTFAGGATIGGDTTSAATNLQPFLALNLCLTTTFTNDFVTELGWVRVFAFSLVPGGHHACDGAVLPVATNTALFSRLGFVHGGNTTTTFALPDLRGRTFLASQSTGPTPLALGTTGGSETVAVAATPAHTHTYVVGGSTLTTDSAGGQPLDNRQPFVALNVSISLFGIYGDISGYQPAVGEIRAWAGAAPTQNDNGWAACEGQSLPVSEYETLFVLIGTTYGGDGQEAFNLPSLGGRAIAAPGQGSGLSSYVRGAAWGAQSVSLNATHLPAHTHTLNAFPLFQGGDSQTLSLVEDSPAVDLTTLLSAVDFDLGQTLTWTVVSAPSKGTLSGFPATATTAGNTVPVAPSNFRYTPTADANGTDSFTIQISDGIVTNTLAFQVAISEVNYAPSAVDDTHAAVNEDYGTLVFTWSGLLANDNAGPGDTGQTLSITAVSGAVGGTATLFDGFIYFTLAPNFNGAASFVYTVRDDGTTAGAPDPRTATATVRFTVTPVNDVPVVATNSLLLLHFGAFATIPATRLRITDADHPDTAITYTLATTPAHGVLYLFGYPLPAGATFTQANINSNALLYAADSSTAGATITPDLIIQADAFTFNVTDGAGGSTGTQTFSIAIRNYTPSVPNDSDGAPSSTTEGAPAGSTTGTTAIAFDQDGDSLTYFLIDDAGGRFAINPFTGVVTVATTGLIDFETASVHYITIQVTDSAGATNSRVHSISVLNAPPSIPTDSDPAANTIAPGAAAGSTVGLVVSAADPGTGAVTYSLTNDPGGRFAINASTGVVTLANPSLIVAGGPASYTLLVKAADPAGLFSASFFTINVVAPTYATWRATVFNASQAALPAFSGMSADPDRDGISNLLEYAFDLDPLAPDSAGLPVASLVDADGSRYLALSYTRAKFASELAYVVEASGDLGAWSSITPVVIGVTDHGDTETVLIRDTVATASGAPRFLRVRVTVTP